MSTRWRCNYDSWTIEAGTNTIRLFKRGFDVQHQVWHALAGVLNSKGWNEVICGIGLTPGGALADLGCKMRPYDADAAARVARLRGPRGLR